MAANRLGEGVKKQITEADSVHLSPISIYEVVRKAHLGKWQEILPHIDLLLADRQTLSAPLTPRVAARAASLDWHHRDPFDRIIAATAIETGCVLVSKDIEFDSLEDMSGWQGRLWS